MKKKANDLMKLKKLLEKCLIEAKKGEGQVSPNPLVGAVVLNENDEIISVGHHEKFGEAHAEVNAIKAALGRTKNATLIVNLEPCSHYGKTPPCVDLIIKSEFKKVVIGMQDPNTLVNGQGIKKLETAGIEVISGVLEDKCKKLNEIFIKNQTEKKIFLAIKTATTLDGKIAAANGSSKWITSEKARFEVQKLRNKYDAILTSSQTVICDNPSLTCRMKNGRNPIRVVVDTYFSTDINANVYKDNGVQVYLAMAEQNKYNEKDIPKHVKIIKCPLKNEHVDLTFLCKKLFDLGIMSVLIEAGGKLNGAFINEQLVDKIYQFVAPKITNDNSAKSFVNATSLNDINNCQNLKISSIKKFTPDIMIESYII